MTTERKPSERAVDYNRLELQFDFSKQETLDQIRNAHEVVLNGVLFFRHSPPTLESELAAMLEAVVERFKDEDLESRFVKGRLENYSTPAGVNLQWLSDARQLLTTYHQRKETTK